MGGPGAADATGHVFNVGDEETVGVGFLAGNADGVAARARCLERGGVVNTHDGGLACGAGDEGVGLGGRLIDITVRGQL